MQVVIPLSDREKVRRNLDRANLCLYSLNFFWLGEQPLIVNIIVPDEETDEIESSLLSKVYPKLKLRIMDESSLNQDIVKHGAGIGYAKQMLIKIAAASIINDTHYLLLDSDIVACRYFSREDLIIGGRALNAYEAPTLQEWWKKSAQILGIELETDFFYHDRMHVTPQILSTFICRALAESITESNKKNWIELLCADYRSNPTDIWTEYTLYYLYARHHALLDEYYVQPQVETNYDLHSKSQNLWGSDQYEDWSPEAALSPEGRGLFMVMQSITAASIDFDELRRKYLDALEKIYGEQLEVEQ